jgi:hypothetical protein
VAAVELGDSGFTPVEHERIPRSHEHVRPRIAMNPDSPPPVGGELRFTSGTAD